MEVHLRRFWLVFAVAASAVLGRPTAVAHADDIPINQAPECQRLWLQLAGPVAQRMLYYVQAADQYPMLPNGRPSVSSLALYPWAPAVYGPGGPGANFVGGYAAFGARNLALTGAPGYPGPVLAPPGGTPLSVPFVANQV